MLWFETGECINLPDIENEQGIKTQNIKAHIEITHRPNDQQKQTDKNETITLDNDRDLIEKDGPYSDESVKQKNINVWNLIMNLKNSRKKEI